MTAAFCSSPASASSELNAGCICCSLVGDFRTALQQVVEQYHPDRILIEPSGVGKLSDVTRAVEGVSEHLDVELNSFVTVADVNKVKLYMKNFGEFLVCGLDLLSVRYGDKAVQLHIQVLRHTFHSTVTSRTACPRRTARWRGPGGTAPPPAAGRCGNRPQRAADAAGVQLIDADRVLQKAASNADLAKFVLDRHDLLSGKGLLDSFDK